MQQTMAAQQAMISAGGMGITVTPQQIVQLQEDMVRLYDKSANGRYFTRPPAEFTGQQQQQGPTMQEQALMAQIEIERGKLELEKAELAIKQQEFELKVREHEDENEFKIAELNLEARNERPKIGS